MMCWHTQAGAAWTNQLSWDGGVESHVLREVNRYKEQSPRKESGRNSVKESEKNSVHENERMNSVHGLEEMNSEWVILHIWRIVSVKSVRRAWKNYCNFSNIFGIPHCTIKYLFVVTSSVKREICVKTPDTCTLTVRLLVEFFFSVYPSSASHAGRYILWPRSVFFFVRYFSVVQKM